LDVVVKNPQSWVAQFFDIDFFLRAFCGGEIEEGADGDEGDLRMLMTRPHEDAEADDAVRLIMM